MSTPSSDHGAGQPQPPAVTTAADTTITSVPSTGGAGLTRRGMLAASAAAVGATMLGAGRAQAAAAEEPGDMRPHVNFSLAGKGALVTGAARGIGRAICVALAAAGADVLGLDIAAAVSPALVYPGATPDELAETGRLVEARGRRWIAVKADVRDFAAQKAAAELAAREFGHLDIAVGNAAIQIYGPLAEMHDDADWRDVIDVNLTGCANTIRAVIPHMIPRKTGRIILISSGQGRHGFKNGSAYSASKWGVIGLAKSAALELGEHQITVNTVEPGLVDTAMTRNPGRRKEALKEAGKTVEGGHTPTEEEVIAARLPASVMKIPWMQPDEVAPAVVFLASDAANRVTGSTYDATAGDSARYTA